MKRFRYFGLLFLLLLIPLNACGPTNPTLSPNDWTAVWGTVTATAWTITPTPTRDPNESKIVEWLNNELQGVDMLEQTLDARYQVTDVSFPVSPSGALIIRVDVRCECAETGGKCCVPERMFLKMIEAMKEQKDKIIEQVPDGVGELRVVCFDHTSSFDTMAALWPDVKMYLNEKINGYQFGARVYHSTIP